MDAVVYELAATPGMISSPTRCPVRCRDPQRPRAPGTFRRQTVRGRYGSNRRRARYRPHPEPKLLVAGDNPPQFLDRITRWASLVIISTTD
jgi:hypothetical protein